jgi:heptosyltransferase III
LKILLIQLRRLGDLILTTPAIVALRKKFPEAHLALAVAHECQALLPAIPAIDETLVFRRGARDLAISGQLRRRHFDCVIDFTQNNRSAWLARISGAKRRIASAQWKSKGKFRVHFYNEFVACAMKDMHTIDYNLALLQPLGILSANDQPSLDLPQGAREQAATIIESEIQNERFALFHPGSTRREKFWEPERWARAIVFARDHLQLQPVLSSGNSLLERAHAAEIRSHLSVPVTDLTGRLDLLTLTALIAEARLLVTVDSAPMHLASATQTAQVVLFGPTNPFHWRPRTTPAAILFGESSRSHFQRRVPRLLMNQISTQSVIDAMRSLHTAPAASAV